MSYFHLQFTRLQESNTHIIKAIDKLDGNLDKAMDKLDGRMDKRDGRMDKLDGRMDKLDGRMDKLDGRMDGIEKCMIAMEGKQQLRNWQLGACVATSLVATAAARK